MPVVHVVKQGECLSSIAHSYGFSNYNLIYNSPENDAFRDARRNPDILLPGDRIVIPDKLAKTIDCAVRASHKFTVTRPKAKVRVYLRDRAGEPIANQAYFFTVGEQGSRVKGTTSGEGLVEQPVPAEAEWADLEVPTSRLRMRLMLGWLDPAESESGARARLTNLGYDGDDLGAGIRAFQHDRQLEETARMDDATVSALIQAHKS